MKSRKHGMCVISVCALILAVFSGCGKLSDEQSLLTIDKISFRDIPGITQSEISAIEALQREHSSFVYAIYPSIEAFIDRNGELEGYAVMFCNWLSDMFGIQFKPTYYNWGDLIRGLESGDVDFTGEVMTSSSSEETYFITGPTINRTIKSYHIKGSRPLEQIIQSRTPRYAFLRKTVVFADISANTFNEFEAVYVDNHDEAYGKLKNGEVDAFFGLDTAEGTFAVYGDVTGEEFFPLVFRSACLSTQKEKLAPIISVMNKAMDVRVLKYLTELQNRGYQKYRENSMYALLTEEERSYIQNNPVIKVGADFSNYPISFFSRSNKWEGIYFEILDEVSRLTELTFEIGNNSAVPLAETIEKVEKGEMLILPELHQIDEYKRRFIWSEIPIVTDHFAFISRTDFRNIGVNDVFHLHVALHKGTLFSEVFKRMFPDHRNFTEYNTMEDTWDALRRGNADVIFSSQRRLVIYTNFYEMSDFKLNLIFNHTYDSFISYNKDAVILKSIIDKALRVINVTNIANQWIYKTYDFPDKIAQQQRPWLVGALFSFFLMLLLVSVFLVKSRSIGKELENMAAERTRDLSFETSKLYAIFDSIPDLIFCKDTKLRYTQCNDAYSQFMGVSEKDFLGKANKDGSWFSAEDTEKIQSTELAVIKERKKYTVEECIYSPFTGMKTILETVKAPIILDDAIIGIVAIVRDITKRKEMEEELITSSHTKSSFLAHMSHELRTPLNVVIGLTDIILETNNRPDEHTTENLIKISNAGSTLLNIVNDILDFSKIESGKLSLEPVEYELAVLLNDITTLTVTRLGEKRVTFRLDITDDLPNKLYGDDLRVKQILTNLLTNAVKFTGEGSIELRLRCTREGSAVWMEAAVTDTGVGITDDNLKNLFLDYYQIITNSSRFIEGAGLGLPITKRLVEMMNGEIKAQSEYGKGSTFSIRIMQGFVNEDTLGKEVSDRLRSFSYSDDRHLAIKKLVRLDLSYARVLVADDMQTNLDVASQLLRKYKMEVDCLNNGHDAVERVREGTPVYNAIFMDQMMPEMDGIETADRIRALGTEYAKKIPIIALTANAIQGTDKLFYEHDFQAYTTKPLGVMELDKILMKWVRDGTREEVRISADSSSNESESVLIEIPGVDTKKALSLYVGDTKVYLPLLRSYAANTPKVLEKLRSFSAENLHDYVIAVHGLKGTSAGIGAEAIREAALELETMSRAGDLHGILAKNDKLIANTEIIVANIKYWLDNKDVHEVKPHLKAPDRELLERLRQSCENYDIDDIEKIMSELESAEYEEEAELMAWIREKIDISKMSEVANRLSERLV